MKPSSISQAERALGATAVEWTPVARGYTQHERWLVLLDDGRRAFVKAAPDAPSAEWLRRELVVYSSVSGDFLPRLLGRGERLLVLEDLSGADWPPPWSDAAVNAVLAALAEVASTPPPEGLIRLEAQRGRFDGWRDVAAEPQPFLSLELCSPRWLERALPDLLAASAAAPLDGKALLHGDVRSDNLCVHDGRVVLVDWNEACIGNPLFDLACWLPSLALEGGPQPEDVVGAVDGLPELAALVTGYFAARAGLPTIATAPRVRALQLAQLEVALPWSARLLGLPDLDR